jgi:Tol biopolymer transport system component/predicted Ser/Thr protein kinase
MEGQRLALYEVQSRLGRGGMGEVWKAWDPRLERTVAIKILNAPSDAAAAGTLAEARTASKLNHPNICTVYEVGTDAGRSFIVMELVEGRPISELIPSDGLAADTVIRYGIQIAEALEHAHESGVVHRDLKGANVMVTAEGRLKLIDFGIATSLAAVTADDVTREQPASSGGAVGTLAYMAPEVLKGDAATPRSDIWSLGVLLYEMAAGQSPFIGATQTDVVAAIVKETQAPLPERVPPALRSVIQRCLLKEPARRYAHAGSVQSALEAIASTTGVAPIVDRGGAGQWSSWSKTRMVGAAAVIAAAGLTYWLGFSGAAPDGPGLRLENAARVTGAGGDESAPSLSRDGRMLAYEATTAEGGQPDIWVMQVGSGAPINRTADATAADTSPVWAPDDSQIAFHSTRDGGGYYVMPSLGGPARRMIDSPSQGRPQWSADGSELAGVVQDGNERRIDIVFLQTGAKRSIPLTHSTRRFDLSWSPDGRFFAIVDAVSDEGDTGDLLVISATDGRDHSMTDGRFAVWAPSWSRDSRTLYFVSNRGGSMDLWEQQVSGDGSALGAAARVTNGVGMRFAALSGDGSRVAYSQGNRVANLWRVPMGNGRPATWADAEQLTHDQAFAELFALSPDGTHLYFSSDRGGNQELWAMPAGGGEIRQLTFEPTPDWAGSVSPDGAEVAFYSFRSGNRDIWVMPTAGGVARQLTTDPASDLLPSWSPDGETIAFMSTRAGQPNIWTMPARGGDATPLTTGAEAGFFAKWSPDGKWLYYLTGDMQGVPALERRPRRGGPREVLSRWFRLVGWSADGSKAYVEERDQGGSIVWEADADGEDLPPIRQLTASGGFLGGGKVGSIPGPGPTTDGRFFYFSWREHVGDIWVMDVVGRRGAR